MPKKTKKEKLLAEYRRKLKLLQQQTAIKDIQTPKEKQVPMAENIDKIPPLSKEALVPSYFLADLKKSLFLVGIIIALEISLYFVRIIK